MTAVISDQYSIDGEINAFSNAVDSFLVQRTGGRLIRPNEMPKKNIDSETPFEIQTSFGLVNKNQMRPKTADDLLRAVGILSYLPKSVSEDNRLCLKTLPCSDLAKARDAIFLALESVGIEVTNQDLVLEYEQQHWVGKLVNDIQPNRPTSFWVRLPHGLGQREFDQRLQETRDYCSGWSSYSSPVSQRNLDQLGKEVEAMCPSYLFN